MAGLVTIGKLKTPNGDYGAVFTPEGLSRLTFPSEQFERCEVWASRWFPDARRVPDLKIMGKAAAELTAYFEGELHQFSIPVDLRGTQFQIEVWQELQNICYGETRSYASIAAKINRQKAVRAVGAANGANPVPIVVPCHRVIGSGGTLTGYAGGLELKHYLLKLEGVLMV